MGLRWNSLFGGSEVEIPNDPVWRTTAATLAPFDCKVETRMVTDDSGSKVEVIFRSVSNSDLTTVTFKHVEGVDSLIEKLIKMRDLLEKANQK